MRILYGVQATGNGHITRARVLLPALQAVGAEVDMLFSGRAKERLFNMEPFGDYAHREGMTLVTEAGKVQRFKTLKQTRLGQFFKDVRNLDLQGYDLVLTDFEPVTAWAARRQGVPSVGVAHQYAFLHSIPGTGFLPWLKSSIRLFAPADEMIGLHWDAFNAPILPPMIEPVQGEISEDQRKVLVYLPFESQDEIVYWLSGFSEYRFRVYASVEQFRRLGNIDLCPFSREGFQQDLLSCRGVMANAGFGLCSEAIQAGKSLLVKPLQGQVEQVSNAAVLEQMGLASVITRFGQEPIRQWLELPSGSAEPWPDVAGTLARWLITGRQVPVEALTRELWQSGRRMSAHPA